jgi:hypothetical protein
MVGDENAEAAVHRRDRCWTPTGMRNTRSCPKRRGTAILQIAGKSGAYGVGNNIPVGWSNFSVVLVTRYLCASCGFSEEWVDEKAGLEKLSAKYNPSTRRSDNRTLVSRPRIPIRRSPWGSSNSSS